MTRVFWLDKKEVNMTYALEIAANHLRRALGGEVLTQTEKSCVVLADAIRRIKNEK